MKRKMRGLLLAMSVLLLLGITACGGVKTAEVDVAQVMEEMRKAHPIQGSLQLTDTDMLNFYGIDTDTLESYSAEMAADGITANEVVLVKAKDEESAKTVETKLQNRLDARRNEFKNYLPDQYAVVEKSEVKRDGVYVRLIMSPYQDELAELYDSRLKG